MLVFNFKLNNKFCPLCTEGKNCGFKFPSKQDFNINGKFSHIVFPISENKFPNDMISYIYPKNWNVEYNHLPFHNNYNITQVLNKIKYND